MMQARSYAGGGRGDGDNGSLAIGIDRERSSRPDERANIGWVVLGVAAGLAAAAMWAAGSVVSRKFMATPTVAPEDLALLRYAGAYPIAVLLACLWPRHFGGGIPWARFAVLLMLAGPLYHALLIFGYRYATAGTGALLVTGMVPVFSLALALSPIGRGRIILTSTIVGAAFVVAGLTIYAGTAPATLAIPPVGIAIFLTVAAMWALLNTLVTRWSIEPQRLTIQLVVWSPLFLPLWLWQDHAFGEPPQILLLSAHDIALQVVVHGWLGALMATALFLFCVRTTGAPTAAVLQAVTPAIAAGLGEAVLGEVLHPFQLAGLAVVIFGMTLAALGAARWRAR